MEEENLLKKDIIRLINLKTESKNHDFKQSINWITVDKDTKLKIIKDILAMSNTQDGGKIIIGVEDDSYKLVDLSEEDFKSFDQTSVNQFLERYADPKFCVQIYKLDDIDGKRVVVIDIPEFKEMPIICAKDAHSSKDGSKKILRKGAVYIRTESAESKEIDSSEDMREFLMRVTRNRSDDLLSNTRLIISDSKIIYKDESGKERYNSDIETFEIFIKENLGQEIYQYGNWEVLAYPVEYKSIRLETFSEMQDLLKKTQVQLRGWYFPHISIYENNPGEYSKFNNGIQYNIKYNEMIEGFRFYQDGLFAWNGVIVQNKDGLTQGYDKILFHTPAICKITEFFIFLKRIYEELIAEGKIYIKIQLCDCLNRKLVPSVRGLYLMGKCISEQDRVLVFENEVDIIDLRLKYKELAVNSSKKLFDLFNCENLSKVTILEWVEKLIEKKPYNL